VGQINQEVVDKIMTKSVQGILDLKRFSVVALSRQVALSGSDQEVQSIRHAVVEPNEWSDPAVERATLKVTLTEYRKGNAALRFFIGFGAGNGKATMEMAVLESATDAEVLRASTTATIGGSLASEKDVIGPLSKAIVKFVKENFKETRAVASQQAMK
jgi:hypothetical protein